MENRSQWQKLAELVEIGLTWIDHPFIEKPIEHFAEKAKMNELPLIVTEFSKEGEVWLKFHILNSDHPTLSCHLLISDEQ